MIALLSLTYRTANQQAQKLTAAGLALLAWYNVRLWQHDQSYARKFVEEQEPIRALTRTPRVSALVAAWNETKHLDAFMSSFAALAYSDIELIICAGGGDGTLERARSYASERVLVLEQFVGEGKQHALARCYERASGEIIYLIDADCLFQHEALVRLLEVIVNQGEQAATGCSRPLDHQANKLLPQYIWMSDVVSALRAPRYSQGLLGRNAAISRAAIERSGGLDFVARTGTDYQLARRLLAHGISIRHVPTSVVPSEYPETIPVYRAKQSRWLRNLLVYGRRYGAKADVRITIQTVGTGTVMLMLPLSIRFLGKSVFVVWLWLVAHSVFAKFRYSLLAAQLHQRSAPMKLMLAIIPLTLIDFAIWALPALDLLTQKRRERW